MGWARGKGDAVATAGRTDRRLAPDRTRGPRPGQRTYELIRPVVLFGQSPAERAALARFAVLPHAVSYTDAVVMPVADEYGTEAIFGFDEDFEKNGYRIIPTQQERRAA